MSSKAVGMGRWNDVDYTYECSSERSFGTFKCKVNNSFLEFLSISELWTEKFRIAGFYWQMYLVCGTDGRLGAYLCSCSRSLFFLAPVAHFSITLVNTNKQNSKSWGSIRRFPSGEPQGKADLASISDLKNEDSGFLHWENFVIQVEIRMRLKENEVCSVAVENNTGTLEWKLKNLRRKCPSIMTTEVFKIDGYAWSLQIRRNGQSGNDEHLSFFLISHNDSVAAEVELCVVNQRFSEKDIIKKTQLDRKAQFCEFSEFMGIVALGDEELGFVTDEWIILRVKIAVLDQEGLKDSPESALEENQSAISETGEPQASGSSRTNIMLDSQRVEASLSDSSFSPRDRNGKQAMEETTDEEGWSEASDGFLGAAMGFPATHSAGEIEQGAQIGVADPEISSHQSSVEQEGPPIEIPPANVDRVNPGMDYSLDRLSTLTVGSIFGERYLIGPERIQGKPHVFFAVDLISNNEKVVLKFYQSRTAFENSKKLHPKLSAEFVCKMLDCIDAKDDYPPCLVFERGDDTLDKWIRRARRDQVAPKAALFQILICISHLHSQGVIHCDIKPSNVAFFLPEHVWKLLDTDSSVEVGEACPIRSSLMYAAPEVIKAKADDNGEKTIIPETSMDMWAFGVLAYEVLTGTRFYGIDATEATVKDCLFGRKGLPSLEHVEERQAKRWLYGLLSFSPKDRPSAQKALSHAVFRTAEDSTKGAAGFRQVGDCVVQETIESGSKYVMTVKNLCNLKTGDEVESKTFMAGGKKWKLGLLTDFHNSRLYEVMKILLISCNAGRVTARVNLVVELKGESVVSRGVFKGDLRTADAFDVLAKRVIALNKLVDLREFNPEDEVVVTVDLTNVGDATEEELHVGVQKHMINVEVITCDGIEKWLAMGNAFGLTSPARARHLNICDRSLVCSWATTSPDKRYWLCKRDKDGHVAVTKCLNEARMLERFEDICTKDDEGCPWVTVFEEQKKSDAHFDSVDENTMIVFCKLFEPLDNQISFIGHRIVQKKQPCQEVLEIACDMARLPEGKPYSAYMERGRQHMEDITQLLTPLPEDKETVSHVIILRVRKSSERDVSVQAVKENLDAIHNRGVEARND